MSYTHSAKRAQLKIPVGDDPHSTVRVLGGTPGGDRSGRHEARTARMTHRATTDRGAQPA
jgi:hypothetical protein